MKVMDEAKQDIISNAAKNIINNAETKKATENQEKKYEFHFDELQMYYGMDYKIDDRITIRQPSIGDIIEFGEANVLYSIMPFISNPTSHRLSLWDSGIDWNKISDYELFTSLIQADSPKYTNLVFGDNVDFTTLQPYKNQFEKEIVLNDITIAPNEIVLLSEEQELFINEAKYMEMREYIRLMFDQHPKVEKAKGRATKEAIIEEERINLINEKRLNKNKKYKSMYLPLISAMLNHPGFKYKKNELKDVGIVEFMDSVRRLQVYESTTALMHGMYSGFCDTSKMDLKKELNWLRDLND